MATLEVRSIPNARLAKQPLSSTLISVICVRCFQRRGYVWDPAWLCRKFEIVNKMMTQPFLKPGLLRPLPIDLGKILAAVQAAVCFALQQYDLPAAQLVLTPLTKTNIGCARLTALGGSPVTVTKISEPSEIQHFPVADLTIVAAMTIMRVPMHRSGRESNMDARVVSKNHCDFLRFSQGVNGIFRGGAKNRLDFFAPVRWIVAAFGDW